VAFVHKEGRRKKVFNLSAKVDYSTLNLGDRKRKKVPLSREEGRGRESATAVTIKEGGLQAESLS